MVTDALNRGRRIIRQKLQKAPSASLHVGTREQPMLLEESDDLCDPGLGPKIAHHEWPFSSHFLRVAPHDFEIGADVGG